MLLIVNHGTIKVSDNFTSELQNIVNNTENVIISTTINSTVIFIAPPNGTRCSSEQAIRKSVYYNDGDIGRYCLGT